VKNSRNGVDNPRARYRKEVAEAEVLASPIVASPLHLLDICATSDGAAAVVLCSADYAARRAVSERTAGRPTVRIAAVSTVTPAFPDTGLGLPDIATEHRISILRHPNQVILAIPDRVAAALVAFHAPVYTGHVADPCRLKAWGFLIPYRGL